MNFYTRHEMPLLFFFYCLRITFYEVFLQVLCEEQVIMKVSREAELCTPWNVTKEIYK